MLGKKSGTAEAVRENKKAERKLRRKAPTEQDRKDWFRLICRCLTIVRWMLQSLFAVTVTSLLATTVVPISIVTLSNILGVGYDSIGLDIVFVFGMPSLFLTGCWTAFDVWLVRAVGRYLRSVFGRVADRFDPAKRANENKDGKGHK